VTSPLPALGIRHTTAEFLLKGRAWVREVGPDVAMERLARAVGPLPEAVTVTYWDYVRASYAGTEKRRGKGREWSGSLEQYADWHRTYAPRVVSGKGLGRCVAHGLSRYGGSSDEECLERSVLWCDLDDGGQAEQIRSVLRLVGLSYVESERVRDALGHHMEIPLTAPETVTGDIPTWKEERYRPEYGWLLGVLSELGEFVCSPVDPKGKPSVSHLGYDAKTDRLLCMHYVFSRRHPLDPVPVVQDHIAGALDWQTALRETGYTPPAKNVIAVFRAKRTQTAPETDATARGESPLERAAVAAGRALGARARGGVYVRCPNEGNHRDISSDKTKAFIHNQRFLCSRGSCSGLGADFFVSRLPEDVRKALENERACEGARRSRDILARTPKGADGNIETVLRAAILNRKPGELIAVVAPPGSGKSFWLRKVLEEIGYGVVSTPTTKLAEQTCAKMLVPTTQHRGVLSVLREDRTPECQQFDLATKVQNAGGSVPELLCKTCPFAKDCRTRLPLGEGSVHVGPHEMHARMAKPYRGTEGVPDIWDEPQGPLEDAKLSRKAIEWAALRLEHDESIHVSAERVLTSKYRTKIRPFTLILLETSKDPQHDLQASALRWEQTDPCAQEFLRKAQEATTVRYDATVGCYVVDPERALEWGETLQAEREKHPHVPDVLLVAWLAARSASPSTTASLVSKVLMESGRSLPLHGSSQWIQRAIGCLH